MVGGGGGGGWDPTFKLLILSPNLLKSKIFIMEVLLKFFFDKSIPRQGVHLDYYIVHIHYVYAGP